jgi:hypothetical protein
MPIHTYLIDSICGKHWYVGNTIKNVTPLFFLMIKYGVKVSTKLFANDCLASSFVRGCLVDSI